MATSPTGPNLQVNASTAQAVSAFNQLTQAVHNLQSQFQQLQTVIQNQSTAAQTYDNAVVKTLGSGFHRLQTIVSTTLHGIQVFGAGVTLVFSSVIRELDKLQGFNAIMTVSSKNSRDAATSYEFLRVTADKLGVQFDSISNNYAKLAAAIPDGSKKMETAQRVFLGIAMAARTMHATNIDTQLMFYAVTQMASKGIVSMEELRRQLGEKLPGVIQIAAKSLNTTPDELEKAMRKGIVISEKFLPIFGDALIRTFAEPSEKAAQSVSASMNRLTNVWVDFVKHILDSGAGNSIIGVFDALREKLSDPYLIQRFADMVAYLADKFTEYVKSLNQSDIRNGIDTFTHGLEMAVVVLRKVAELMTWLINNAPKAGAVIGALGGAALGSFMGPYGLVVGAAAGGVGGYYAGLELQVSPDQLAQRAQSDAAARAAADQKALNQETLKYTQLIPLLQKFEGLNSLNKVQGLFKPEMLNESTIAQVQGILANKIYKSAADRVQALIDLSNYGMALAPNTATLQDVLGSGKPKSNKAEAKKEEGAQWKAWGFEPNFLEQWNRYNKLAVQGRISTEDLEQAQHKLLMKQPVIKDHFEKQEKALWAFIDATMVAIAAKEGLNSKIDEELRLSGMFADQQQTESRLLQELNQLREKGVELSDQEIAALRSKLQLLSDTQKIQQIANSVRDQSRFGQQRQQANQLAAYDRLTQDPLSGVGKQDITDQIVLKDQNASGSQQWIEAQKRSLQDYYDWIDKLRERDLVSEQTAQMMKSKATIDAQAARLSATRDIFGNLSTLMKSSNKDAFRVGRAAAAAQATIDGYVAVQKALASAPPPMNYALAAAVGIATAANVKSILSQPQPQYYLGGYTGDGPRSGVAGVTHGQEFVVNAAATARNRALLEQLNRGGSVLTPGQSNVNIVINNTVSGTTTESRESQTPDGRQIEITIRRVVAADIRRAGPVAAAIETTYGLNRAAGAS